MAELSRRLLLLLALLCAVVALGQVLPLDARRPGGPGAPPLARAIPD